MSVLKRLAPVVLLVSAVFVLLTLIVPAAVGRNARRHEIAPSATGNWAARCAMDRKGAAEALRDKNAVLYGGMKELERTDCGEAAKEGYR